MIVCSLVVARALLGGDFLEVVVDLTEPYERRPMGFGSYRQRTDERLVGYEQGPYSSAGFTTLVCLSDEPMTSLRQRATHAGAFAST